MRQRCTSGAGPRAVELASMMLLPQLSLIQVVSVEEQLTGGENTDILTNRQDMGNNLKEIQIIGK